MITVVGLGIETEDLTERGKAAILGGGKVILRTDRTRSAESVKRLGVAYETLDGLYVRSRNFSALHNKLARAVLDAAKTEDVVYCVDGSVTEDKSAEIVLRKCKKSVVVGGVSKVQRALEAARLPANGAAGISAYDLAERKEAFFPLVIYDLDDRLAAGDVKLWLADQLGEESEIFFLGGGKRKKIRVYELDRQKRYEYDTAVVAPEVPLLQKKRFSFADLQAIIERLRLPDGCPWDRAQTPESIRMNMVEEAYELVDAIDSGDADKIREETGDVLLQGVFHAVMQEEQGNFNLTDVVSELCGKLIFRHTHIFGKDKATDAASALSFWEKNKAIEKGQDTYAKAVRDVPAVFPACMRAQKVQKRAGKSGFDFPDARAAAEKIGEELKEWEHALDKGDQPGVNEELGDLLFAVVNAGRLSGVDCELALKESTDKFVRRFTATENAVIADGKDIRQLSAAELDDYYCRVKEAEKRGEL